MSCHPIANTTFNSIQIQPLSFKRTSRTRPKHLTRTHSTPFNPSSGRFIRRLPLSCRRFAPHIPPSPLKSPLYVQLHGLCTSPRSSTIGKQPTTEEKNTRFRLEHPEGLRACGEERLQQLRRSYIHETKLQRSGRGRMNRLSRSVWTTLPPIGFWLPVRLGRRKNLMLTCRGWQGSSLLPHIFARTTLRERTFGLLVSLARIVAKSFVEGGTVKQKLAW